MQASAICSGYIFCSLGNFQVVLLTKKQRKSLIRMLQGKISFLTLESGWATMVSYPSMFWSYNPRTAGIRETTKASIRIF